MVATSKKGVSTRDLFYFRRRYQNRLHAALTTFFAEEARRTGITQREVAERLGRDPAQINRLLAHPSNLTADTISDFLLALGAEPEPPRIVRFSERSKPNYAHPLIARALGEVLPPPKEKTAATAIEFQLSDGATTLTTTTSASANAVVTLVR
ncbi:MAG: helix-turn-helix transcriptional regulator [Rhodospirillales bacterium]|nr:helix-turn-helix transcriptional regulator [Rhodospirillales bacterium]